MASLNITFPIYNENGTVFHDLVIRNATYDSVVMSLGDKITGDVYYRDSSLEVTMREYIRFRRSENDEWVKFIMLSPPTLVHEGMVADNSELKGMAKYSFEFYHPMCILSNLPFSDVAVSNDQLRFLSQNKEFSWIGNPIDYIAKLNKNLQGTQWIVLKSDRFPAEKEQELSDVLTFSNNTIAEALKVGYETWGVPYIVDQINAGEEHYSEGKRFAVIFGLPANEIYETENSDSPFVFRMGQGVGLKNNSRTPRNNKIITRIAGYGSENNIPYGYPQIRWYGNQEWTNTKNNPNDPTSYPIYQGIVGGEYVKLIKHPFTRTHLMPSIYSETVFNKVSPYVQGGGANPNYNSDLEIIDYYDAVYSEEYPYVNEIDVTAPSYEIHEFADIKPELNDGAAVTITNAVPLNNDLTVADAWDDTMDEDGNYLQSYFRLSLPILSFDLYACAAITQEMNVNFRSGACIGCTFPVQVDWDDYKKNFYDDDGNFSPQGSQRDFTKYPNSQVTAIDVVVQKEYATFGTIMPNVYQQPHTGDAFVFIGISLPLSYITNAEQRLDEAMLSYMWENNVPYYDYPLKFDEYFLVTHQYILNQIKPNSIIRFCFGEEGQYLQLYVKQLIIKYGTPIPQYDITLTDNIEIVLNQIGQVVDDVERLGTLVAILRQTYGQNVWSELAKKLSKSNNDTANGLITFARGLLSGNYVEGESGASIDSSGNAEVESLTARDSIEIGDYHSGSSGAIIQNNDGVVTMEIDYLSVRRAAEFREITIAELKHVGGQIALTPAAMKCTKIELKSISVEIDGSTSSVRVYRCYFDNGSEDGQNPKIYNEFQVGDLAMCQQFNLTSGNNTTATDDSMKVRTTYYWRLVLGVGDDYIDLYSGGGPSGFSAKGRDPLSTTTPKAGDDIVQFGNINNADRQNAIVLDAYGSGAPSTRYYKGIGSDANNRWKLEGFLVKEEYYDPSTHVFNSNVYGNMYVGNSSQSNTDYMRFDSSTNPNTLEIRGNFINRASGHNIMDDIEDLTDTNMEVIFGSAVPYPLCYTDENGASTYYTNIPSGSDGTMEPAQTWSNEGSESLHDGALFYVTDELGIPVAEAGYCYRWQQANEGDVHGWYWFNVWDKQTIWALSVASKKTQVYTGVGNHGDWVDYPVPPYNVGDQWRRPTTITGVDASGNPKTWSNVFDVYVCKRTNRNNGASMLPEQKVVLIDTDWEKMSSATEATIENLGNRITLAVTDSDNKYARMDVLSNYIGLGVGSYEDETRTDNAYMRMYTSSSCGYIDFGGKKFNYYDTSGSTPILRSYFEDGVLNFLNENGRVQISIGTENGSGNAILSFYDAATGNKLYDLGPEGIKWIETHDASLVKWSINGLVGSADYSWWGSSAMRDTPDSYLLIMIRDYIEYIVTGNNSPTYIQPVPDGIYRIRLKEFAGVINYVGTGGGNSANYPTTNFETGGTGGSESVIEEGPEPNIEYNNRWVEKHGQVRITDSSVVNSVGTAFVIGSTWIQYVGTTQPWDYVERYYGNYPVENWSNAEFKYVALFYDGEMLASRKVYRERQV